MKMTRWLVMDVYLPDAVPKAIFAFTPREAAVEYIAIYQSMLSSSAEGLIVIPMAGMKQFGVVTEVTTTRRIANG